MAGFEEKIRQVITKGEIKEKERMSGHTTFRIGGPADYYVIPANEAEVVDVVRLCRAEKMPFYIIGNGSNLLVGDQGYRGVIIQLFKNLSGIVVEGTTLTIQAGTLLSQVAACALEQGLAGFEFAAGIPGTMGGAVMMNAGAYGGEIKDVIVSAKVLTTEGEKRILSLQELELGYRTSSISRDGGIVLEAKICLEPGDQKAIADRMEELKEQRTEKQPLEYPSAGSTFKRPEGYFAGKLIDDAGLRGFRVGGAQVSEKHCGFVINRDHATAAEVMSLMEQVSARVKEQTGVTLEPEVKRIGEF